MEESLESKPQKRDTNAKLAHQTNRRRATRWREGEVVGWPELDAIAVSKELGMTIRSLRWWMGDYSHGRHEVGRRCGTLEVMVRARKLASLMGIGMEELVDRWVEVEREKKDDGSGKEIVHSPREGIGFLGSGKRQDA